ncbi:MAG: response regulator [Acidobacteriota bacterium]|jgi:CheY-like chemotaxis protein|nr:response regulator [Acidobacteriota bacterium]
MESKNVLLVDDDSDFNEINRMALERAGFKVFTAENSAAAKKILAVQSIDVAVLDVMMDTPTEGFDLARDMRQDPKTKRIPLLMLTSVNTKNEEVGSFVRFTDRERDREWLPVDRFVDKPIKPEELVSAIRTLAGAWTFSRGQQP